MYLAFCLWGGRGGFACQDETKDQYTRSIAHESGWLAPGSNAQRFPNSESVIRLSAACAAMTSMMPPFGLSQSEAASIKCSLAMEALITPPRKKAKLCDGPTPEKNKPAPPQREVQEVRGAGCRSNAASIG